MFSQEPENPLLFTPDAGRENAILQKYAAIEKKIAFFSLPDNEIKQLVHACHDIEASSIIGFDTEKFETGLPDDIYNFCLAVEEKYSNHLTHYEAWISKNKKDLKADKPETWLGLINALAKSSGSEYSSNFDFTGIKNSLQYVLQSDAGVFTQSWMLRMVLEIFRPFANFAHAYPAAVQSVYLDLKGKKLKGLLHPNMEALKEKDSLEKQLEPFMGLTAGTLKTTDLTPLLELGYDILDANLERLDELVRHVYRKATNYYKKEPRIRNLLNYLYAEGTEAIAPFMPEFNERQQQIIKYLFTKRYLGTKELTLDFKCDRKTIQRDFGRLLSSEVVRSTGNGSALKYCINLKNNGYDMVEIYNTPVRRKEEYQESLFGEEIWETKKA